MLGFKPKQLLISLIIAVCLFTAITFALSKIQLFCLDGCSIYIGFPFIFGSKVISTFPMLGSSNIDFNWHYNWILLVVDVLILWIVTLAVWKGLQKNKTLTIVIVTIITLLYTTLPFIIGYFSSIPRAPTAEQQKMIQNRMQYINNLKK